MIHASTVFNDRWIAVIVYVIQAGLALVVTVNVLVMGKFNMVFASVM